MEDLRNAFDKISAKDHCKMVAFIRLSLRHLAELESLDRRHLSTCIGLCPPDDVDSLPNLPAPPRNVAIHNIINASKSFAEQIKSRLHTLQFSDLPIQDVVHLLHVLNSHSDLHPTLTTLNFCRIRESGDSESEELIGSIKSTLKRHSIICLHFDRRRSLLQESELQDAVKNSRKAWMRRARDDGHFQYRYGQQHRSFQVELSEELPQSHFRDKSLNTRDGQYAAFEIHHHDIIISDNGEIFMMIYIPRRGKIVLTFTVQTIYEDVEITVQLTRSNPDGQVPYQPDKTNTESFPTSRRSVHTSDGRQTLAIDEFLNVPEGCYELVFTACGGQYFVKEVDMDFIPATRGRAGAVQRVSSCELE
ncbi:hypothetical protein L218DRAFT_630141 [Marasmius fiardii PR-910]|nr:hypothetical protein L218DRAFT_630141 [Marasmius fiardii PR-910]